MLRFINTLMLSQPYRFGLLPLALGLLFASGCATAGADSAAKTRDFTTTAATTAAGAYVAPDRPRGCAAGAHQTRHPGRHAQGGCRTMKKFLAVIILAACGAVPASLVSPKEVFRGAIVAGAVAIVIAHNHPSGDPAPSSADIRVTRALREAARILEIELLDHVVCGEAKADPLGVGYHSFREAGLL